VFNVVFNNISVILWSVLLVEETGVPEANHRLRYMNLVECVAGILLQMKETFVNSFADSSGISGMSCKLSILSL
jgi:hypothetical protein